MAHSRSTSGPRGKSRLCLLVATRKGAFFLKAAANRRAWQLAGPHYLGNIVSHMVLDPRDRRTLLAAARIGHPGPTVFRSLDLGKMWKEARRPPAFPKAETHPLPHHQRAGRDPPPHQDLRQLRPGRRPLGAAAQGGRGHDRVCPIRRVTYRVSGAESLIAESFMTRRHSTRHSSLVTRH